MDRILRAAIYLVDESGIESLSMRNLSELLGVATMSLYNHVASKEQLLDGMIDLVAREVLVPTPGVDWRSSMRQRAISTREVILRHPWAARLIESQTNLGPGRLLSMDATLGSLRRAGFSVEAAARALLLMDSYIYGFILQETSWRFDTSSPEATAAEISPQVAPLAFPHLAELLEYVMSDAGDSRMKLPLEFEFGFELILDAVTKLIDADS